MVWGSLEEAPASLGKLLHVSRNAGTKKSLYSVCLEKKMTGMNQLSSLELAEVSIANLLRISLMQLFSSSFEGDKCQGKVL